MAKDLNMCLFIGRLGKDPEIRYTQDGKAIASFSIAVGESWTDKSGNKQERTEWINATTFGPLAEKVVAVYLKKGSQVQVTGKWRNEKWQDRETGQDRFGTKLIVNELQMLGGRNDSQGGGQQNSRPAQNSQPAPQTAQQQTPMEDLDDDIPF